MPAACSRLRVTDIYSALSAAVGSLKGPKHGGANQKVNEMLNNIESNVKNWKDEGEVKDYLVKIVRKEANDKSGLIYGMGHAIYTLSDPRAVVLKEFSRKLAEQKGMVAELDLIETVEKLAPGVLMEIKGGDKPICANVDLYSGFVYKMLGIPEELFTPIFAVSRMAGWCAHRIEEFYNSENRIIRPAYKAVTQPKAYVALKTDKKDDRQKRAVIFFQMYSGLRVLVPTITMLRLGFQVSSLLGKRLGTLS